MQNIFRYRKFIGLTVVISIFLLNFPVSPARAVMITTEYAVDQDSDQLSDRTRVKAFLGKTDVMAQLQTYGISHAEALSRVDSLTDREIAALAGKMDQNASMAGGYEFDGSLLAIVGLLLYTILFFIVFYYSRAIANEEESQSSTGEKEEEPQPSTFGMTLSSSE
jgi:hypothetical protein